MTGGDVIDLPASAVHVWITRVAAVPRDRFAPYLALLSDDERARHQRFLRDSDRDHFLVAHAQLRLILSRYARVAPEQWQFRGGAGERPIIEAADGAEPLHFSLSHTDGLAAIAVSRIPEIGIDAERTTRTVDRAAVAQRVFTQREIAWAAQSADPVRFFQLWTLKEAYAKARGLGLAINVQRVAFEISDAGIAVVSDPSLDDGAAWWQCHATQPTPGHVCAIAVRRSSTSPIGVITRSAEDI